MSGRDLMELGMRPGRELGSMLSELLEYVIDDPERNTKEKLCAYVKENWIYNHTRLLPSYIRESQNTR